MKKIKSIKKCSIYQLTPRELKSGLYTFEYAIVLKSVEKDLKECGCRIEIEDRDWECDTLEESISWCENY